MIDKRLLDDSITVELVKGKDEWGKNSYSEPISLDTVRIDRSINVSGANNSKVKTKSSTIFIYPKFHPDVEVTDEWLEARVSDGMHTFKVVGYQVNHFNNKLFSYEVEVI